MTNGWQQNTNFKKCYLGTTDYKHFSTPFFYYWNTLNIGNGIALNFHSVWSSCLLCPDVFNSAFSLWVGLTKKLIWALSFFMWGGAGRATFRSEIAVDSKTFRVTKRPSCQKVWSKWDSKHLSQWLNTGERYLSCKRASVHGIVKWRRLKQQSYSFQACLFNSWQWKWLLLDLQQTKSQIKFFFFFFLLYLPHSFLTVISFVRKWVHTEINYKI